MVDPEKNIFSHLVRSSRKIWLLFLIPCVGGPPPSKKIGGTLAPRTFWWGVADPLEIRHSTNAVMADLVVLSEIMLSG